MRCLPCIAGVQFLSENSALTLLGAGDSRTSGYVNGSGFNGFGLRASLALSRRHGITVAYAAQDLLGVGLARLLDRICGAIAGSPQITTDR